MTIKPRKQEYMKIIRNIKKNCDMRFISEQEDDYEEIVTHIDIYKNQYFNDVIKEEAIIQQF